MRALTCLILTTVSFSIVSFLPERNVIDHKGTIQSEKIKWVKSATERYSPDSWYMLQCYDALPEHIEAPADDGMVVTTRKMAGTYDYLQGITKTDLLASMETNVHEIAHGFFNLNVFKYVLDHDTTLNWEMVQGFIYISPSSSYFISCPKNILFPSNELEQVIPKDRRTFRFDQYICGNTSTQGQGVIGLLDEMHAYYLDSKYCFDMLEAFIEAEGSVEEGVYDWVERAQSTLSSFWEFDFYIKEYLLYMKDKYPSDYIELINCRSFTDAYLAVRSAYASLISQYEDKVGKQVGRINRAGKAEARISDGTLWINQRGSRYMQGTPLFAEAMKILRPVLESKRYDAILKDIF